MNEFKILLLTLTSFYIIGCEQAKEAPKKIEVNSATESTVNKESFRYTWLENIEATKVSEGDSFDKNYYFVIDGSGSMDSSSCEGNEKKIDIAKRAVVDYAETLQSSNLGMIAFDNYGTSERVVLSKNNFLDFKEKINEIRQNDGTPLKTAITMAYDKLKEQGAKQGSNGEYNLIIVTDGEASNFEDPKSIVKEIGSNSPVNITTIGFCLDNRHSLNDPEYVNYYSAKNYSSIIAGLSKVQSEGENYTDEEYLQMLNDL